jgi:hypothetical protein
MLSKQISHALLQESREYAQEVLKGLTAAVSHFHGVKYMKERLASNGF